MNRDFKGVWIPKRIWLDKNLGWSEKLLLVEIDSLDNESGCWANNGYFADFFNLSKDRVSRMINKLKDKGYIEVTIYYKEGTKQVDKRVIKVNRCIGEITDTYLNKHREGIGENTDTPIGENAKDNNTSFNNTINNTNNIYMHSEKKNANSKPKKINLSEYVSMTQEEYEKLIEQFGEVNANERIETLNLYKGSTGKKYKNDYLTILNWARKEKKGANNGTNIRRNENAHAEASKISETNERRKKLANIKSNTDIDISF
ncbi:helix-turn-helix domain-containing protein [Niallia sp. RD1]|uniref:helix-turn-helix domain-containing protein n=1 Tax=Niallia sp. RD1 TaxID=2962858 RepID=UPI0020C1A6A2|nr:helix-turn-helix domain-containing protein [Niallia sp. RD1]UTI41090.1 helix-turn-helix domain-containing protein [Niallia sp. RD1]